MKMLLELFDAFWHLVRREKKLKVICIVSLRSGDLLLALTWYFIL